MRKINVAAPTANALPSRCNAVLPNIIAAP